MAVAAACAVLPKTSALARGPTTRDAAFVTSAGTSDASSAARELAVLRLALADAVGGMGPLLLLVDEPGIGKTRLAQEIAAGPSPSVMPSRGGAASSRRRPGVRPWLQIRRTLDLETDPLSTISVGSSFLVAWDAAWCPRWPDCFGADGHLNRRPSRCNSCRWVAADELASAGDAVTLGAAVGVDVPWVTRRRV